MLSVSRSHQIILTFACASDGSDSPAPKTPATKKGKAKGTGYVATSRRTHTRTYTD
jgi:hypothetical protein